MQTRPLIRMMNQNNGIFLLDKPPQLSSFQALAPLKRIFRKTKIGHAGTLDPAATGLLVVGIGSATRLLEYLEGMEKTYTFRAYFGFTSESYDCESPLRPFQNFLRPDGGEELKPKPRTAETATVNDEILLTAASIEKALDSFRGKIEQAPPNYSAIKIDGERAYDRARAGEDFILPKREVIVYDLRMDFFETAPPHSGSFADFTMTCSKGTYVRSLVHDLGLALGCGAVTDRIRRIAIGPYRVEKAQAYADFRQYPLADGTLPSLQSLESAIEHLPSATLNSNEVEHFLNGRPIHFETDKPITTEFCALDENGKLIAIATYTTFNEQGRLCPTKVLVPH